VFEPVSAVVVPLRATNRAIIEITSAEDADGG
jgi:hypothetical protein